VLSFGHSRLSTLLQLYESGSLKVKVETPPDGSVDLHCFMDVRRTTRFVLLPLPLRACLGVICCVLFLCLSLLHIVFRFVSFTHHCSLDMRRPLVKQNSFRVNRSFSDPGAYEAASASLFTAKAAESVAGAAGAVDASPPPPPSASKSPEKSGSSGSVKSDKCCVQ
jgi:hypothetical protein